MRMDGKPQGVEISDERFERAKVNAEDVYKTLTAIPCPYLKADVHFNAKGFEHLKFKSRDKARNRMDQYTRFKLVHIVPEIIHIPFKGSGKRMNGKARKAMVAGKRDSDQSRIMSL